MPCGFRPITLTSSSPSRQLSGFSRTFFGCRLAFEPICQFRVLVEVDAVVVHRGE
jgi:hypothetical protein